MNQFSAFSQLHVQPANPASLGSLPHARMAALYGATEPPEQSPGGPKAQLTPNPGAAPGLLTTLSPSDLASTRPARHSVCPGDAV